jgi:hypothetical protein
MKRKRGPAQEVKVGIGDLEAAVNLLHGGA